MEEGRKWKGESTLEIDQYSHALVQIDDPIADADRRKECHYIGDAYSANSSAAIASDRNTGRDGTYRSVYAEVTGKPGWQAQIVWNDNHVSRETSHILPRTRYGENKTVNTSDNLFAAAGPNDAMMTYAKGEFPAPYRDPRASVKTAGRSFLLGLLFVSIGVAVGIVVTLLYQRRPVPDKAEPANPSD